MRESAPQVMARFRSLVKARGWKSEELWDLLRSGFMSHCPPSYSTVARWLSCKRSLPNGERLLCLVEFLRDHSRVKHDPKKVSVRQTKQQNKQTKTK
jgi:hypothetical protein